MRIKHVINKVGRNQELCLYKHKWHGRKFNKIKILYVDYLTLINIKAVMTRLRQS